MLTGGGYETDYFGSSEYDSHDNSKDDKETSMRRKIRFLDYDANVIVEEFKVSMVFDDSTSQFKDAVLSILLVLGMKLSSQRIQGTERKVQEK